MSQCKRSVLEKRSWHEDGFGPDNVSFSFRWPCALRPMAPQAHLSRVRQSFEAAHEELIRTGYLRSLIRWV